MRSRLWAVMLVAAVGVIYLLRLDAAAGLYVDDAWYIVLAQALANGDGYALVSSATTPILPAVPPGFPLLLAPIVAILPAFPANILALKAVSLVAMCGVATASYWYLIRCHAASITVAGSVALITAVTPAFVFLATSTVMAECAFTLAQLGAMLLIERAAAAPSRSRLYMGLAAVVSTAALLIRSAGIASLAAGAIYLAMRRGWRTAAGYLGVAALCYAPWALYAGAHRPTDAARAAHGGSIAYSYADLLMMRRGGEAKSGRVDFGELPARVGANLVNVVGRDVGALILPSAYRGPDESGLELVGLGADEPLRPASMGGTAPVMALSVVFSAVVALGFLGVVQRGVTVAEWVVVLTLGMVALVPTATFRYALPLTPFVVFYFLGGIEVIASRFRRVVRAGTGPEVRITALCLFLMLGLEHAQYIWKARYGPLPMWLRDQQDVSLLADWMNRNLTSPGHVASTNPGLVYLLTGRKGIGMDGMSTASRRWSSMGVRYAAALRFVQPPLQSKGYRVIYQSPHRVWVAELTPAATTADIK